MEQTGTTSLGRRLLSCAMAVVLAIGLMPAAPYQAVADDGGLAAGGANFGVPSAVTAQEEATYGDPIKVSSVTVETSYSSDYVVFEGLIDPDAELEDLEDVEDGEAVLAYMSALVNYGGCYINGSETSIDFYEDVDFTCGDYGNALGISASKFTVGSNTVVFKVGGYYDAQVTFTLAKTDDEYSIAEDSVEWTNLESPTALPAATVVIAYSAYEGVDGIIEGSTDDVTVRVGGYIPDGSKAALKYWATSDTTGDAAKTWEATPITERKTSFEWGGTSPVVGGTLIATIQKNGEVIATSEAVSVVADPDRLAKEKVEAAIDALPEASAITVSDMSAFLKVREDVAKVYVDYNNLSLKDEVAADKVTKLNAVKSTVDSLRAGLTLVGPEITKLDLDTTANAIRFGELAYGDEQVEKGTSNYYGPLSDYGQNVKALTLNDATLEASSYLSPLEGLSLYSNDIETTGTYTVKIESEGFYDKYITFEATVETKTYEIEGVEEPLTMAEITDAKLISQRDEIPVADGTWNAGFDVTIVESGHASDLSSWFDPRIKVYKAGDTMTLSLLYTVAKGSVEFDYVKLNSQDMTKTPVGTLKDDGSYTVYEYTAPITSLSGNELKVAYTVSFSGRTMANEHTFAMSPTFIEAWPGDYADIVHLGTNETAFQKPTTNARTGREVTYPVSVPTTLMKAADINAVSMAADIFKSPATVSVAADGTATVTIDVQDITVGTVTDYLAKLEVYQTADTTGAVADATLTAGEDGKPAKATFTVPSAVMTSLDGVFVKLYSETIHPSGENAFLAISYDGSDFAFTNEATGVVAEGASVNGATLEVEEGDEAMSDEAQLAKAEAPDKDEVDLFKVFDVTLADGSGNELTENLDLRLSFPVGAEFDGRTATVTQYHNGEALDPQTVTVADGMVKITVTQLSAFAISIEKEAAEDPSDGGEDEAQETQEMHRLYNPNSGEHFYTASDYERDHLVSVGWKSEGEGWTAPKTSNTPVYRLYNPNAGDHHYTKSEYEKDYLVSVGWKYESIGWYSDDAEGVPLYRQYNPNAKAGAHNYTTSKAENDHLVSVGWNAEDIAWYGVA